MEKSANIHSHGRVGASFLYAAITRLRNACFDLNLFSQYRSSVPVICVGNLTVGGSGKTPLVMAIVELLRGIGRKPVVLSRGYGGSAAGPLLIAEDSQVAQVGDEPLLMRRRLGCPVVIARKRVSGAQLIEREHLGDVIVLDDGLQHRWLARTLNIVTIDVSTEEACNAFLAGEMLPRGKFRENPKSAFERIDVVMLSSRSPNYPSGVYIEKLKEALPARLPVFHVKANVEGFFNWKGEGVSAPEKAVAFCGIANPQSFFRTLTSFSIELHGEKRFADHYQFSERDLSALRQAYPGLPLICTEKDFVRIKALPNLENVLSVKVSAEVAERERFLLVLQNALLACPEEAPRVAL